MEKPEFRLTPYDMTMENPMKKEQFIASYIEKRMKNHNLSYGVVYLSVLETVKQIAEKKWEEYYSKQITEQ